MKFSVERQLLASIILAIGLFFLGCKQETALPTIVIPPGESVAVTCDGDGYSHTINGNFFVNASYSFSGSQTYSICAVNKLHKQKAGINVTQSSGHYIVVSQFYDNTDLPATKLSEISREFTTETGWQYTDYSNYFCIDLPEFPARHTVTVYNLSGTNYMEFSAYNLQLYKSSFTCGNPTE